MKLSQFSLNLQSRVLGGLSAPSGFTATLNVDQADLAWTDTNSAETGYEIHRSTTGPSSGFSLVHTTAADAESWSDTTIVDGTTYYYKVRAKDAEGEGPFSSVDSVTYGLLAPSSLSATASAFDTIDLSWTDNSGGETGFKIERSLTSGSGFSQIDTVAANTTTYEDSGLTAETTYYYRVRAYDADENSSYSSEDSDTTPAEVSLPNPAAYYAFDESDQADDAVDAVGSLDIAGIGTPDPEGTIKKFSALDYSRDCVNASNYFRYLGWNGTVLDYEDGGDWSVAIWVYPVDAAALVNFLRFGNLAGNPRVRAIETGADLMAAELTMTTIADISINSVGSFNYNAWNSIVLVIDVTNEEFRASLNGETPVTASLTGGTITATGTAYDDLEIAPGSTQSYIQGLSVWDQALTTDEMAEWHNSGSGYYWNGSIWVSG